VEEAHSYIKNALAIEQFLINQAHFKTLF